MKKRGRYGRRRGQRRRSTRKRVLRSRFRRFRQVNQHKFISRTVTEYQLLANAVYYGATPFRLSDVPNPTKYTGMYDQYRITGIKQRFYWAYDGSEAGAQGTVTTNPPSPLPTPWMYLVHDYDDAQSPTSVNELIVRPGCKIRRLSGNGLTTFFRPCVNPAVYKTGIAFSYSTSRKNWIDCSNSDTPYYGIKFAIDPMFGGSTTSAYIGTVRCITTYYFECKNTR